MPVPGSRIANHPRGFAVMSRHLMKGHWGQVAVIAGAVLIVALGLCMVARDVCGMDDQRLAQDVCAGMVLALPAALLLATPFLNGWFLVRPVRSLYAVAPAAIRTWCTSPMAKRQTCMGQWRLWWIHSIGQIPKPAWG